MSGSPTQPKVIYLEELYTWIYMCVRTRGITKGDLQVKNWEHAYISAHSEWDYKTWIEAAILCVLLSL